MMQETFSVMFENPDWEITERAEIVADAGGNEILPRCIETGLKFRPYSRLAENDRLPVLSQHANTFLVVA